MTPREAAERLADLINTIRANGLDVAHDDCDGGLAVSRWVPEFEHAAIRADHEGTWRVIE